MKKYVVVETAMTEQFGRAHVRVVKAYSNKEDAFQKMEQVFKEALSFRNIEQVPEMPLNDEGFCAGGYIDEDAAHIFGPAEFAKGAIVELNSFKIEEVEVGVTVGDFLSYFCKQDDEETQVNIVTGCNSIMYVPCTQNYKLPENIASIELSSAKVEFFEDDANYPLLVLNREKGWLNYCYTLFGENGDILGAFETLAAGKPNMFWLAKKVQESVPKEKIAEITLTVEEQNGDYLDSDTLDDEGLIKMLQCGKLNSKIESSIWK